MNRRNSINLPVALLLVLCAGLSCATDTKPPYIKEGKTYGVTKGFVWRPTWWNYYERGISFAAGGYWQDAVEDFQQAIRLRESDRRRSRTYGMHFVDYFPHRELGIVYYRMGHYEEAIEEIKESLSSEESAKAEYFLNRARKAWLEETGADRAPPEIYISRPVHGFLTNELSLWVQGVVRDDQYASKISVNQKTIPVFLAKKQIPFSVRTALNPGMNRVEITAQDLVGKVSSKVIHVHVDRAGPVLFLEPLHFSDGPAGRVVVVSGEVRDNVGLSRMELAHLSWDKLSGRSYRFEQPLRIPIHQKTLRIEAEDVAGNITTGTLPLQTQKPPRQVAMAAWPCPDGVVTDLPPLVPGLVRTGGWPPLSNSPVAHQAFSAAYRQEDMELRIHLKDLPDFMTVYYESLYVEGSVTGPDPVQNLEINGEQLLDRKGRNIFFSYLIGLEEGKNEIRLEACDLQGNRTERQLSVRRRIPKILCLSERMRISLLPFHPPGCSLKRARLITEDLLTELIRQRRFHMVERERLEEILAERKLSTSRLTEDKHAARIGRILAAEGALVGAVFETPDSIEVLVRLVDTETSRVLLTKDAFTEEKSLSNISSMMEGLAYKLRQGLPLLEGSVLRCEKKSLYLNVGQEEGVIPEQRFLIFREGPEIRHPVTQFCLGREMEILAEGRILDVYEEMSSARITRKFKADSKVQAEDEIITK